MAVGAMEVPRCLCQAADIFVQDKGSPGSEYSFFFFLLRQNLPRAFFVESNAVTYFHENCNLPMDQVRLEMLLT